MLHAKFQDHGKLVQWRCLEMVAIYMYIAPGQGADNPLGSILFH